jgi:hypothetical protein
MVLVSSAAQQLHMPVLISRQHLLGIGIPCWGWRWDSLANLGMKANHLAISCHKCAEPTALPVQFQQPCFFQLHS